MKPITKKECLLSAKQYNRIIDWYDNNLDHYNTAKQNGWFNECIKHIPKSKYKSFSEWKKANPREYGKASNSKILFKVYINFNWNIPTKQGTYTKEFCKNKGLEFKSRWEWQKGHQASYSKAKISGWLDECCVHMKPKKYTKQQLNEIAIKYKNKSEWLVKDYSSYNFAKKHNLLDECCVHMIKPQKTFKIKRIRASFTYNEINIISKNHKTRKDWREKENSSYQYAKRNGWLKNFTKHMVRPISQKKHTLEKCMKSASKFDRPITWKLNDLQTYRAAYQNGWLDKCCKHMVAKQNKSSHTKIDCLNFAKKYFNCRSGVRISCRV